MLITLMLRFIRVFRLAKALLTQNLIFRCYENALAIPSSLGSSNVKLC
jgi:hypothetical protein